MPGPEQLVAPGDDDLSHVPVVGKSAQLVGAPVVRHVLVLRVQREQGLAQLTDVNALTVDVVHGPEHQPDPQGAGGCGDRSHHRLECANVIQDVDTKPLDGVVRWCTCGSYYPK